MAEEIYFDKKEQLQIVQNSLLPDETVFAVYDGKDVGTGFIGLTDRRVILQDNSFAGGRVAVTLLRAAARGTARRAAAVLAVSGPMRDAMGGVAGAVTSGPYSKVTAVSYASNASVFGRFTEETTVAIHTSHGTYEVLLRGSDKAKHTHDVILHYVVHA